MYMSRPHALCIVDSWRATPALTLETTLNECIDNNAGSIHDAGASLNSRWPSDLIWVTSYETLVVPFGLLGWKFVCKMRLFGSPLNMLVLKCTVLLGR